MTEKEDIYMIGEKDLDSFLRAVDGDISNYKASSKTNENEKIFVMVDDENDLAGCLIFRKVGSTSQIDIKEIEESYNNQTNQKQTEIPFKNERRCFFTLTLERLQKYLQNKPGKYQIFCGDKQMGKVIVDHETKRIVFEE